MSEREGRDEQLTSFFRDRYIPKELDNPVVMGLLKMVASNKIHMRMIDVDGVTFINISPATTAESTADFERFLEEFEVDLHAFAPSLTKLFQDDVSGENVKDTVPLTVIVPYPSIEHVEAVSEATTLQRLLGILSTTLSEETRFEWEARIEKLLEKYPRYNLQ